MSERSLEDRAFDAVVEWASREDGEGAVGSARLSLVVATFGALARREGMQVGIFPHSQTPEERFRLPTRTVRKLREEPDPANENLFWRWNERKQWPEAVSPHVRDWPGEGALAPTKERRALWDDLEQRPYHEESVPVDPNEVLP